MADFFVCTCPRHLERGHFRDTPLERAEPLRPPSWVHPGHWTHPFPSLTIPLGCMRGNAYWERSSAWCELLHTGGRSLAFGRWPGEVTSYGATADHCLARYPVQFSALYLALCFQFLEYIYCSYFVLDVSPGTNKLLVFMEVKCCHLLAGEPTSLTSAYLIQFHFMKSRRHFRLSETSLISRGECGSSTHAVIFNLNGSNIWTLNLLLSKQSQICKLQSLVW